MKWLAMAGFAVIFTAQAAPEMCFTKAVKDFGIDPRLLMAHSIKESRMRKNAINDKNTNKTADVCNMQINSSHYKRLKDFNITRERFLADPCIYIYTGSWIEAHNFRQYGRNLDSVWMYNTGPSPKLIKHRHAYADDIKNIYKVLVARDIFYARTVNKARDEKAVEKITYYNQYPTKKHPQNWGLFFTV